MLYDLQIQNNQDLRVLHKRGPESYIHVLVWQGDREIYLWQMT